MAVLIATVNALHCNNRIFRHWLQLVISSYVERSFITQITKSSMAVPKLLANIGKFKEQNKKYLYSCMVDYHHGYCVHIAHEYNFISYLFDLLWIYIYPVNHLTSTVNFLLHNPPPTLTVRIVTHTEN